MPQFCILFYPNCTILATQRVGHGPMAPLLNTPLGHLSGLLFKTIKLSVRSFPEVATDPHRIQILLFFSGIRIGSESSFIRRCGSGSEFGFALPNNLGTKSALHSAKTFLSFALHLNFGRENAPIFSEDFFIFIFLVFT